MTPPSFHYELLLPNPVSGPNPKRPELLPLTINSTATSWLEVGRFRDARIQYRLGGGSKESVGLAFEALRTALPGLALGRQIGCAVWGLHGPNQCWLRAAPVISDRLSSTLRHEAAFDAGSLLLRQLSSDRLAGADVVVQYLFRPTSRWEMGRFARPWWGLGRDRANPRGMVLTNRAWDFPYHVEIRVAAARVSIEELADVLGPWFDGWTSTMGTVWWTLHRAKRGREAELQRALFAHDIFACASSRRCRDLSAAELTVVLPFPWKERHPNVRYVGAPEGRAPVELVAGRAEGKELVLGRVGNERVRLPDHWHHLVVVGKTGAGKSTLVRSLVLQILQKEPAARVIVLEPTGSLIEGIVGQLPEAIAGDTIEIDPARASFQEDGVEQVAVPLNLLHRPDPATMDGPERERRAGKIVSDLILSIKNAWGPESVGGRAEHVLQAFVQALLPLDGTTLADVHAALTDKAAFTRLGRLGTLGPEGLPLPKLGVEITISSIDKVGKIAGGAVLRKALCQRYGTVPFGDLLRHRLLLLNLRDGAIGTEGANFLGAILLTQLWSALQERVAPGQEVGAPPPPVYLVVDEFQHYAIKAFAAMLSEGRRLGLRVIAASQTLGGIPETVLPALMGNVDAWVMFPLGAKDQRDGWRIVQGQSHGWTPDDLAEGPLGPHQAAYFARGTLLKLTTAAPPPGSSPALVAARRASVHRSTRRYARPEDSTVSPLAVSQGQRLDLLGKLSPDEGSTTNELAKLLGWDPRAVHAAVSLSRVTGDVARETDGRVRLLPRGRFYREAVHAARNEGEEHCGLLADVMAYLDGLDVDSQLGVQRRVEAMADATFERNGRRYNVEVECSNLAKHVDQIIRNVRKAVVGGRRCLVAVAAREEAERLALLVATRIPEAEMWGNFGLLWRGGPGVMVPYPAGEGAVWGWLLGMADENEPDEGLRALPAPEIKLETPVGLSEDQAVVRTLVTKVAQLGNEWATARDLLDAQPPGAAGALGELRIGKVLASLGVPHRRVRSERGQVRLYHIASLATRPEG